MIIQWHQNPLKTSVELDERDIDRLVLYVQNEKYANLLCRLDLDLRKPEGWSIERVHGQIGKWGDISDLDETHEQVQDLIEALKGSHGGDCVCWPCTCDKCVAEEALGINTTKGLAKHPGSYMMSAFPEEDTTIDEAIQNLEKPILYENRHSSWTLYSKEEYMKYVPKWEIDKAAALAWLKVYKEERGF